MGVKNFLLIFFVAELSAYMLDFNLITTGVIVMFVAYLCSVYNAFFGDAGDL